MRAIVDLDRRHRLKGRRVAEEKIHALAKHSAHRRVSSIVAGALFNVDQIGEPYLREHANPAARRLVQNFQKPLFIGAEKSPAPVARRASAKIGPRQPKQQDERKRGDDLERR